MPERRLRTSDLAPKSSGSLSRLSHVGYRFSDLGLVDRVPCEEERRVTFAVLTTAGYRKLVAAAPNHVEHVRRLVFDPLTRDQAIRLRAGTARILDRSETYRSVETRRPSA